jgi:predicted dinucleotide-binding enzyme
MTTAIIGVGNIGGALARDLVRGGEPVVLAARDEAHAAALAQELGPLASAAPVVEAIVQADVVVFAVWLDQMKELIAEYGDLLTGKVVADPSTPVKPDGNGGLVPAPPEGPSNGAVVAGLLPAGAHYVKAFGTLGAESLGAAANRSPRRAVLFYATDDERAAAAIERLLDAAGFDPVYAGGGEAAARLEGDLHQYAGLGGRLLDADEARAAVTAVPAALGVYTPPWLQGR